MEFILSVIGVVLIVEGIPVFISPDRMVNLYKRLDENVPARVYRTIAAAFMVAGLVFVYMGTRHLH